MDDGWRLVWAEMTDEELEGRLFTYHWLARNTPNTHPGRIAQLEAEAVRRGRPDMVERAKQRAATARADDKGD